MFICVHRWASGKCVHAYTHDTHRGEEGGERELSWRRLLFSILIGSVSLKLKVMPFGRIARAFPDRVNWRGEWAAPSSSSPLMRKYEGKKGCLHVPASTSCWGPWLSYLCASHPLLTSNPHSFQGRLEISHSLRILWTFSTRQGQLRHQTSRTR